MGVGKRADVVIVGRGLAGLSCGPELTSRGYRIFLLESEAVLGGRTSSRNQEGMPVESGLHRVLGFYRVLPELLAQAGINIDDIVCWEDEVEIRLPDGRDKGVFGAAPLFNPVGTFVGGLCNWDILSPLDRVSLAAVFTAGMTGYLLSPKWLDQRSVRAMAECYGVTKDAIHNLLVPLTSGLYFLAPERYSASAFFGTFVPYPPNVQPSNRRLFGRHDVSEGRADRRRNSPTRRRPKNSHARSCAGGEDGRVAGVDTAGERFLAPQVVVAASLVPAQRLIADALGQHPWFAGMLRLPSMPAVTLQAELNAPRTSR